MKHLILGGGGFIGSHLCRRLVDESEANEVTIADIDFPSFRESQYQGAQKLWIDLRDSESTQFTLWDYEPDVVWQFAADMGGVEYFHSQHDWAASVNNGAINHNVMTAMQESTCAKPKVIFTSTACALATETQTHDAWMPTEENDITWGTPDQLYGQEKRNSALMWKASPFDTRVTFLHTVYGPYQEFQGIKMKFPSAVVQKARQARDTGTIELLGNGKQVRTFLYIDDAIDRLLALAALPKDPGFVQIAGTTPYTCRDVAIMAADVTDVCDLELKYVDGPIGVEHRQPFQEVFKAVLPQFTWETPLATGLATMADWMDESNV